MISAQNLGSAAFRDDYGLRYAYAAGAMVKGIASAELVIRMARAGFLAFYGSGGVSIDEVENQVHKIRKVIPADRFFGVNLLADPTHPDREKAMVDRLLELRVRVIEASAFLEVSPALIKYRLKGIREMHGQLEVPNRIMAKVSHPKLAAEFLHPPAPVTVQGLLERGEISTEEAALAQRVPLASDITVEADSAGHTDMGVTCTLLPAIVSLRNDIQERFAFDSPSRVGSAGGIGTPQAAASAFMMGADYLVTGSINQCTVEGGTSAAVKDLLQQAGVRDTSYAPAGDMFELGAKVQVLKKGVFFPARANKLYDLWRWHGSLDDLPANIRREIENKYMRRSFEEVYEETRAHYAKTSPADLEKAERNPKHKMALVFRWYFVHSMRLALAGDTSQKTDWQIYCGPALGAFNNWVAGTEMGNWRNRHVDDVAQYLLEHTAQYLRTRVGVFDG